MSDDVVAEQVDYYRQRASEYDATSHGDSAATWTRVERLVGELQPRGRVLEIACGTGLWTGALTAAAESVTALDSSPEALAIARRRVGSGDVRFVSGDVFTWQPDTTFDAIFFGFWLSHVPAERFSDFWLSLATRLADHGRVLFVDEHLDEQSKEDYVAGRSEIVERKLNDGNTFHIVKNFLDPEDLAARLRDIGWDPLIRRDGTDWVVGEARPAR